MPPPRKPPRLRAYTSMPTWRQWKRDSAVGNIFKPRRKHDHVLYRIDAMVKLLRRAKNSGEMQYLLGEIFFATLYWNNHYKPKKENPNLHDPKMHPGRRPAIMRLNLYAANTLAAVYGCSLGSLASTLTSVYGKGMVAGGRRTDSDNQRHYLTAAKRECFKIFFKDRLAYRLDWRDSNPKAVPRLADSGDYEEMHMDKEKTDVGECGYAMSMSREFYVGPFVRVNETHNKVKRFEGIVPRYHSSFMGGRPVMCAGSITIKKGIITYISNYSGHYGPSDGTLVRVVEQLKLVGVDISKLNVHGFAGAHATGTEFLRSHGNWGAIHREQGRWWYEQLTATGRAKKKEVDSPKVPFRSLVKEQFLSLKSWLGGSRKDIDLWAEAYVTICLGLGQFDVKYLPMAKTPPIPMTPHGPRPIVKSAAVL